LNEQTKGKETVNLINNNDSVSVGNKPSNKISGHTRQRHKNPRQKIKSGVEDIEQQNPLIV
jgi:hypothetical protein